MKDLYNNSVAERYSAFINHSKGMARTDADGNFEINIDADSTTILIADGRRMLPNGLYESYFWVSLVDLNQSKSDRKIILSNKELISFESFFRYSNKNIENMFKAGVPSTKELESLDEAINN